MTHRPLKTALSFLSAGLLFFSAPCLLDSAEWIESSGGDWNNDANWDSPTFPFGIGDTASINLDGTYTVNGNVGINIDSISIGTTSASGVQSLNLNTFAGFNFGDMTIGANGVFNRTSNGNVLGSGLITIQAGGLLNQANSTKDLGAHSLLIESGGELNIASGHALGIAPNQSLTVNGEITGDGNITANVNGISYSGTGTIGGGGTLDLSFRQSVWSGSLTVDKDITNTGAFLITDGDQVTINGTFTNSDGNRGFGAEKSGESATIIGSGDIFINTTSATGELRFGGANTSNNGGGTLNVGGSGTLNFDIADGKNIAITASALNLQRDTVFTGSSTVSMIFAGGNTATITLTGAGNSFTLGNEASLFMENRSFMNKQLIINDGGELIMAGGSFGANVSNSDAGEEELVIGVGTTGTINLAAGTTSTFETVGDGGTDKHNMRIMLGENATTIAGVNSVLELKSVDFHVAMTDESNWGWGNSGEISIHDIATSTTDIDRDGRFEALSSNLGAEVDFDSIPFVLNMLSFVGSDNLTFSLMETVDNDGSGADNALYVRTLNLTNFTGSNLDLDGLTGNVVYYGSVFNPNGVTLSDSEWVQVIPEPGTLSLLVIAGVAFIGRRRRK